MLLFSGHTTLYAQARQPSCVLECLPATGQQAHTLQQLQQSFFRRLTSVAMQHEFVLTLLSCQALWLPDQHLQVRRSHCDVEGRQETSDSSL
ncbi:hypothetical protein ABBQ38_010691 [Trebouxia sp. C0009 RCD-2024]